MTARVYILLPVHNRREITRRFVACLKGQTYANYHLVLLDDGSTDGTAAMVKEEIRSLTVLQGTGDWWWAGALQRGYEWLKERTPSPDDLALIINDDTEFEADFLEKGVACIEGHPGTLLLAQSYDRRTGELIDAGIQVDWRRMVFAPAPAPERINCLSTRGLFLRMTDFFAVGGFRPKWLPHYLSDYEFTIRASRMGKKLWTDPALRLYMDKETTGYHALGAEPPVEFLRRYFSKKSASNPFAWTAFLVLACPWPWKLMYLPCVWLLALGRAVMRIMRLPVGVQRK